MSSAVLAGHQALVASVARFARTTITSSQTFQVQAEHFGTFNEENLDRAPNILKRVCSPCRRPNLHRNKYKALYDHQLPKPRKLGLGSSAAVTTTLLQGLHTWHGEGLTPERLLKKPSNSIMAFKGQERVDIAAAVFGGTIAFSRTDLRLEDVAATQK